MSRHEIASAARRIASAIQGEVIAHHHQRDPARDVRRRHPQDIRLLRLAQAVHLVLPIRVVERVETRRDILVQLIGRERRVEGAWIEQLVEEHRVPAEELGDPRARRAQLHELRQRDGTFGEQCEIDAALRHRLDHGHRPLQGRRRVVLGRDGTQQVGHEAGEALVRERIRHLERDGVAVSRKDRPRVAGGDEPRFLEQVHTGRFIGGVGEQGSQRIACGRGIGTAFLAEHLRKLLVHVAAVMPQPLAERVPVRIAHGCRDAPARSVVQGKHVFLSIVDLLETMLRRTQESVGGAQRFHRMGRQQLELAETFEHREEAPVTECGCAPAAHHLKRLRGELDLPYSAGTVLHAVLHALAGDLLLHHRLQRAQRLKRAEVDVAPIHERAKPLEQLRREHHVSTDCAGSDERVPLPVAAMRLVVLLERVEAEHERPLGSERSQAHVDAIDEAVRGRLAEYPHELPRELEEEAVVVDTAPAALGPSVLGEGEDEIDVGGEVQLAGTELAEREDNELLGFAGEPDRGPEVGALPFVQPVDARGDDGVCEI